MTNKMTNKRASELLAMIKVEEPDAFIVNSWWGSFVKDYRDALQMAIKALEQEPCEDCISRQDALNCVTFHEFRYRMVEDIKALPSVTPKEKTGHWIDTGSGQKCSRCGEIQYGYDGFRRFCASCGIRMVEPQESEVER